jgi:hypothetical protein
MLGIGNQPKHHAQKPRDRSGHHLFVLRPRTPALHHPGEHSGGVRERAFACRREREVLAGAAALHGLRLRELVADEPLVSEPRQGGVHGADRDLPSGSSRDFLSDRDPVRLWSEVGEGEHDVDLEFAEKVAFGHVSSTNAYLDGDLSRKV